MIRALLFDLDNTLVPEEAGWNAAFDSACAPAAAELGFDLLRLREAVFGAAQEVWEASSHFPFCDELGLGSPSSLATFCPGEDRRYQGLREWLPSFRYRAWDTGLRAIGIKDYDLVDRLSTRYMAAASEHSEPFEGVDEVLQALHARYRLAVVTNGFTDLQRQKLSSTSLNRHFDATLISGELGYGKPNRRIFEAALSRLGVETSEAIVIGDSPVRDIAGALEAGITPIWLRRDQEDSLVPASVLRIEDLQELPALLQSLEA